MGGLQIKRTKFYLSFVAACSSSSECEADFGAMSELFEDLDDDDAW